MTIINFKDNGLSKYELELDKFNIKVNIKKMVFIKDKEGNYKLDNNNNILKKEVTETIGYFGNLTCALREISKHKLMKDEKICIDCYLNKLEEIQNIFKNITCENLNDYFTKKEKNGI